MAYDVDRLISVARERLAAAQTAEKQIRQEQETDLRFKLGGKGQWNEDAYQERKDANKPALTINQLGAFSNTVNNDIRQLQPELHVSPKRDATEPTADVLEGMARSIQNESDASLAFDLAARYAVDSSFGCFRLLPILSDPETNEMDLAVLPVYDPSTVYFDPSAKDPTRKDARWAMVIDTMSRVEYREQWPNSDASVQDFFPDNNNIGSWMNPAKNETSVIVCEYWCVEEIDSSAIAYGADLNDDWDDGEKAEHQRKKDYARVASFNKARGLARIVVKHILNGYEELEPPTYFPGEWLPLFPVYGEETWIRGERFISSFLRDLRDPSILTNWSATKMAETLASDLRAPYLMTPRMVQNQEKNWLGANNSNKPYLLFNPDKDVPEGPRKIWSDPPIGALSEQLTISRQQIRDISGLQDPSLGQAQYAGQSGVAVGNLQRAGSVATFHYQDNLQRTIKHFGRLLLFWIPFYYDTEREITILGEDMTPEIVMVNTPQPYTDPKTNKTYHHQLDQGRYEVTCNMAPSSESARAEADGMFGQLLQSQSDLVDLYAYLYFKNSDTAGAKDAAELVQRAIAIKMPGLFQDPNNALPPQAAAQLAQLQQQVQQLGQQNTQMSQLLKTRGLEKQMELKAKAQISQADNAAELQRTNIQARAHVAGAAISAGAKAHGDKLSHEHGMFVVKLKHAHDAFTNILAEHAALNPPENEEEPNDEPAD